MDGAATPDIKQGAGGILVTYVQHTKQNNALKGQSRHTKQNNALKGQSHRGSRTIIETAREKKAQTFVKNIWFD